MSNIDDVKNLYEGIAAEAYKMPDRVDPADIRKAQRAKKVRNLATDGATEGERAAAERKTKGPKMFGEGKYSNSETYVKGTAPVRATYGGKTESFPKETYNKKSKKNVTEDICPICGFNPCQCLEGTLRRRKIASRQIRRPCTTVLRRSALSSGVSVSASTDNMLSLMLRVTSHGMM